MDIATPIPCTYTPGELTYVNLLRGGQGFEQHQNPFIYQYPDGRVFLCWYAYDIDECSNDGLQLYAHSYDRGETWDRPEVWLAAPNAVTEDVELLQLRGTERALMVYCEAHMVGNRMDKRLRKHLQGANYGASPVYMLARRSDDAGLSWGPPEPIAPQRVVDDYAPPFYGSMEQLLQLADGRLLLVIAYLPPQKRSPQHFHVAFLRSDDEGQTWRKTWDLTVPDPRGAMEPCIVEVSPGQLWGVIRNKSGFIYDIRSADGGETWTEPRQTNLPTPEAMAKAIRLQSGALALLWNNQSSTTQQPRHPLVAALSDDGGETWGRPKVIADELGLNQLSNFYLAQLDDGRILVATHHWLRVHPEVGNLDLAIFDEAWLRKA